MRYITPLLFAVLSSPAWAASGPFVSLKNTNFIVLLAFILFIAALIYLKVPAMIGKLLDQRAEGIQADLDQARLLREEAQGILAEYERKQKEVQEQADRIVEAARAEAASAAEQGKADLQASIERRLAAAEYRITSAQAAAEREVRDQAVSVAIAAARGLIAEQMSAALPPYQRKNYDAGYPAHLPLNNAQYGRARARFPTCLAGHQIRERP